MRSNGGEPQPGEGTPMGSKGGGNVNMPSADEMARAGAYYNRLNQYTPYGSVEYIGPDKTTVVQQLSPEMQALQEQMLGLRGSALSGLLARYGGSPISLSNPSGTASDYGYSTYNGPPVDPTDPNFDPRGYTGDGGGGGGPVMAPQPGGPVSDATYGGDTRWVAPDRPDLPELAYDLDLGSLPAIPGQDDLMGLRGNVEQAYMDRQRALLDPVFQERETGLREMLANRGLPAGASVADTELSRFERSMGDAYTNAANDAIMYGGNEMSRMLSDAMGVRQGSLAERLAQLGATNQTQQQGWQQWMGERGQSFAEQMGLSQQEFSELASILGLAGAPGAGGDLGQFYGPSPVDVMGAYNTSMNAQMYNNQPSPMWDIIGGLIGAGGQMGGAYLGTL
jgi:hypothetical protein